MAGQRQPTELLLMKGKKHLTKAEIEERKKAEVNAPCDNVNPPEYLSAKQKKKFQEVAEELQRINLIANIDCDALARVILAQEQYITVTKQLRKTPLMVIEKSFEKTIEEETGEYKTVVIERLTVNPEREKLLIIQDRCWKQCRQGAADFGMTVASRCRLVVPKDGEPKKDNKFAKYAT